MRFWTDSFSRFCGHISSRHRNGARVDMTHLYKGARVDSDREGPDMGKPTLELDAVGHGREGEDASAGREEVTCVVISVEANEVRVEHAEKNLTTNRQYPGGVS